jgi:hypothetical protein
MRVDTPYFHLKQLLSVPLLKDGGNVSTVDKEETMLVLPTGNLTCALTPLYFAF